MFLFYLAPVLATLAVVMFYVGNMLIGGVLLPQKLAWFYQAVPSEFARMLVLLLPIFGCFNYVLAKSFAWNPGWSAPAVIAVGVLMPMILSYMTQNFRLNLEITLIVGAIIALSVWLSFAISRAY